MNSQLFALGMILRSLIKLPLGIFALAAFFLASNITFILILIGVKKNVNNIVLTKKDFMFAVTKSVTYMSNFFDISKEEQEKEFINK